MIIKNWDPNKCYGNLGLKGLKSVFNNNGEYSTLYFRSGFKIHVFKGDNFYIGDFISVVNDDFQP